MATGLYFFAYMSELNPQNFLAPGYISSSEAGDRFGLTNDYVARLCRHGKIRGALIGKVWFVEESSLGTFVSEGERRKKHYSTQLAKTRRAEYRRSQTARPTPRQVLSASVLASMEALAASVSSAAPAPQYETLIPQEPAKKISNGN